MAKKFLTLNIGAATIELAEYEAGGKGALKLTNYGIAPLAAQLDGGNAETILSPALLEIVREKGIKPGPVSVSLSGQMAFQRFAAIPMAGGEEKFEQMVRYEIEQNVPFPIDEIVSDHQFIGEAADGDKTAMIVAAKLDAVRAVTDAVRAAGLKPVKVDVSPIAICNALKFSNPGVAGCSVVLDIGSKSTNLIILEDEKIYNRSINVAGNLITKEIAQALGCSFEEAEQLKLERGYVALGGVTEDEDEITDQVSKVIRTVLTRLHAEISRSVNFYRSQQGGSAPNRLYLTGGSARLPQLDQFFMESLQVEVEFLNPFVNIGLGPKVKADMAALEGDAFTLTESVGLALRGTDAAWISINLMPPELLDEERAMKRIPFVVAGGVAILAALGIVWFAESQAASSVEEQLEVVNGLVAGKKLAAFEGKIKSASSAVESEKQKCDEFQKLLWGRSASLARVRAVRESLIPGMWITEWTALPPPKDDAEGKEGVRVTIRGWRDAMTKAEADWSAKNGGKKSTSAEIVMESLKGRSVFVSDSVKVVSQKEVKECLTEFAIQLELAPAPSVMAEKTSGGRNGKAGKKR